MVKWDLKQNSTLVYIEHHVQTSSCTYLQVQLASKFLRNWNAFISSFESMSIADNVLYANKVVNIHVIFLLTAHDKIASRSLLFSVLLLLQFVLFIFFLCSVCPCGVYSFDLYYLTLRARSRLRSHCIYLP